MGSCSSTSERLLFKHTHHTETHVHTSVENDYNSHSSGQLRRLSSLTPVLAIIPWQILRSVIYPSWHTGQLTGPTQVGLLRVSSDLLGKSEAQEVFYFCRCQILQQDYKFNRVIVCSFVPGENCDADFIWM